VFGVSFTELVVIMLVVLIVFGPDRLPEMAAKLGKGMAELRKISDAVRREFYNSMYKPTGGELDLGMRDLKTALLTPPARPQPGVQAAIPAAGPPSDPQASEAKPETLDKSGAD
jgi:sec-independent protein translocase protein TatA